MPGNELHVIYDCLDCPVRSQRPFCNLPRPTLEAFERIKTTNMLAAGAVLFREAEVAHSVLVLCSGRVKLYASGRSGRELIAGIAEAGEVLGLSAVLSSTPYEFTAVMEDPGQVNRVAAGDFLQLLSENAGAGLNAARSLSLVHQRTCEQVKLLGLSPSTLARLSRFLIQQAKLGKSTPKGVRVVHTRTQEELAEMLGTTRETVSRLFSVLKEREIISSHGAALFIHNVGALELIAGA